MAPIFLGENLLITAVGLELQIFINVRGLVTIPEWLSAEVVKPKTALLRASTFFGSSFRGTEPPPPQRAPDDLVLFALDPCTYI